MTTMSAPRRILHGSGMPYYLQVADHLRADLREGRWTVGQLIPSEAALCASFGVSRTAIRQALGELVAEGLLQKQRGRGTFVSRPKPALTVQETRGFFDEMTGRGHAVATTVVGQSVVTVEPALAADLHLPVGGSALQLVRTRNVGPDTLVYVTTHLPLPAFAALVGRDLTASSLYRLLADEFGVEPARGTRRISALKAGSDLARCLGVRRGDPVLRVEAVNVDADGSPFEAFEAYYRADRAVFEVELAASVEATLR